MLPFIKIAGLNLPTYGLMALVGLLVLAVGGIVSVKKAGLSVFDGIVLGAYGIAGAYIGSRLLYSIEHPAKISISSEADIPRLIEGGGTAYGGILLGIFFVIMAGKVHRIDWRSYIEKTIFLLPLCHAVWKVGCHFSGCCYGIYYDGPGSIILKENSKGPSGVNLFPVQITETVILLFISVLMYFVTKRSKNGILIYLTVYSAARFLIEFLRNPAYRAMSGPMSLIQYICIAVFAAMTVVLFFKKKFLNTENRAELQK